MNRIKIKLFLLSTALMLFMIIACSSPNLPVTGNENKSNVSIQNNSNASSSNIKNPWFSGLNFIGVKSFALNDKIVALSCHYSEKLTATNPILINDSKILLGFELVNVTLNDSGRTFILLDNESNKVSVRDWVRIQINKDEFIELPVRASGEVVFVNGKKIFISVLLIRNNEALICINVNEEYDIAFCESKSGSDRFLCFDNLGYINGIDYCQKIQNSTDKRACEGGALGTNG